MILTAANDTQERSHDDVQSRLAGRYGTSLVCATKLAFGCVIANTALGAMVGWLLPAESTEVLHSPVLGYHALILLVASPIIESIAYVLLVEATSLFVQPRSPALVVAILFAATHLLNGLLWPLRVLPLFLATAYLYRRQRAVGTTQALTAITWLHALHNAMCWIVIRVF